MCTKPFQQISLKSQESILNPPPGRGRLDLVQNSNIDDSDGSSSHQSLSFPGAVSTATGSSTDGIFHGNGHRNRSSSNRSTPSTRAPSEADSGISSMPPTPSQENGHDSTAHALVTRMAPWELSMRHQNVLQTNRERGERSPAQKWLFNAVGKMFFQKANAILYQLIGNQKDNVQPSVHNLCPSDFLCFGLDRWCDEDEDATVQKLFDTLINAGCGEGKVKRLFSGTITNSQWHFTNKA